jgi:hypothetical protein
MGCGPAALGNLWMILFIPFPTNRQDVGTISLAMVFLLPEINLRGKS